MVADPIPEDAVAFFAAEYDRLVGGLGLYVGDGFLAEELAQEALLRACRRWETVSRLDSPGGWAWRVAVNLANSHFRRLRAERRARQRLAERSEQAHRDVDIAEREAVRRSVAGLPRRQKHALVLRYFLDLSAEETARRMDTSNDAVRSLTKRAVASLRDELGGLDASAMVTEVGDEL